MRAFILTLVLVVFCLLGAAYMYLGTRAWHTRNFLSNDEITTSTFVHRDLPYTLNYSQHQAVLALLNRAKKIPKQENTRVKGELRFYSTLREAPLILYPLRADYSLFTSPTWNDYNLAPEEPRKLKNVLDTVYDS